jgi:hypothetical protein
MNQTTLPVIPIPRERHNCIMDEAARVPDELLAAIRRILATTNGRFFALSTPSGKRGWWHEAWTQGDGWERISVKGSECPRVTHSPLTPELVSQPALRRAAFFQTIPVSGFVSQRDALRPVERRLRRSWPLSRSHIPAYNRQIGHRSSLRSDLCSISGSWHEESGW